MLDDLEHELALEEVKVRWYAARVDGLEERLRRAKLTLDAMHAKQRHLSVRATVLRNKLAQKK